MTRVVTVALSFLAGACGLAPTELAVVTSGGFAAAYAELAPAYADTEGLRLTTAHGASMGGAPDSIPSRLERGERFDVLIMSRAGLDQLVAAGLVTPESVVDLASSVIGMAVPLDVSPPDIGSVDAFRQALLEAPSIAYSASVSGTYLSSEVFPRLGIADAVASKSRRVESERVGAVVARGEAAVGFQQVPELLEIDGIRYVGEIPESLQRTTMFSAGVTRDAADPVAAAALIAHFASDEVAETVRRVGLRPASAP